MPERDVHISLCTLILLHFCCKGYFAGTLLALLNYSCSLWLLTQRCEPHTVRQLKSQKDAIRLGQNPSRDGWRIHSLLCMTARHAQATPTPCLFQSFECRTQEGTPCPIHMLIAACGTSGLGRCACFSLLPPSMRMQGLCSVTAPQSFECRTRERAPRTLPTLTASWGTSGLDGCACFPLLRLVNVHSPSTARAPATARSCISINSSISQQPFIHTHLDSMVRHISAGWGCPLALATHHQHP